MRIACIDSDSGLRSFAAEWTALWQCLPEATPFQLPGWLLAWWRLFGNSRLCVLVAREGSTLSGVLPLYVLDERGSRKLLPIGVGLSDYIDMLIAPDRPAAADALLAAIKDVRGWDECHLPDLMPGSAAALAAAPAGLAESRSAAVTCPVLGLPADPASLGGIVPPKTLRDLRQAAARAGAAGGAAVEAADPTRPEPIVEDLFRLHSARWQARGETGVCDEPAVRGFHLAAARALGDAGLLRLYRLRIGGCLAAVYYGFNRNGRAYAYLGGFNPGLPRLSPGALILSHAIRRAIAEGRTEFHFLRGGETYKYAWGAVDRQSVARTLRRA